MSSQQQQQQQDGKSRIGIIASHIVLDNKRLGANLLHHSRGGTVVTLVGSCIMDVQAWNGSIHATGSSTGKVMFSPGGVCMNIARALRQLEKRHGGTAISDISLVSVVGDDNHGRDMVALCSREGINTGSVLSVPGERTATVVVVFDDRGDVIQSVVDVSILETYLDPEVALKSIRGGICVMDGDLHRDVIETVCKHAAQRGCQIVFDPATVSKSGKCISVLNYIDVITPNIHEIEEMARLLVDGSMQHTHVQSSNTGSDTFFHRARACVELVLRQGVKYVLLTAGEKGAGLYWMEDMYIHVEYSFSIPVESICSVNGAGDSLVAGFIYAISIGKNEKESLSYGMASAWEALQTDSNVPEFLNMTRFNQHVSFVLEGMKSSNIRSGCCCSTCCHI